MEQLKHTLKAALKNVWFNKKQYIYFVVLLVFIQSLVSCVFLLNHNNNLNEMKYMEDEFQVNGQQYHIIIGNMTPEQVSHVKYELNKTHFAEVFYHIVRVETVTSGTYKSQNMYIRFADEKDADASSYRLYQRFLSSAVYQDLSDEGISVTETPYLLASRSAVMSTAKSIGICAVITAIGTVTFGILFNTVVNHFKFSYGIYMTYGANFKKLLSAALSEMILLNLFTFIPSFLVSILVTFLLTVRAGYGVSVKIAPMFIALLCSLILTVISVTFVIKKLSISTPDKLIRSVNNVGLITSPRFSHKLPQGGFPVHSELLSMKRFRKYIIGLVLSTLIFVGAFCGGTFLMDIQSQKDTQRQPQFILSFPTNGLIHGEGADTTSGTESTDEENPEEEEPPLEYAEGYTYTPDVKKTLYNIDGVDYIVKNRNVAATYLRSHILIPTKRLTANGRFGGVKSEQEPGYSGFCNVDYTLFDAEVADNITFFGGTITGDLERVLTEKYVVAISDSFNNARALKLKVGDTIKFPTYMIQKRRWPTDAPGTNKELMEAYLYCYRYEYAELTVGAIVSDLPVGSSFPVYMNAETFSEITGTDPYFANVEIYCDEGASDSTIRAVQTRLSTLQKLYKNQFVNTFQESTSVAKQLKNYPGIILYVSVLLLVISVLINTLSQSLFYQMRKQELDIYLCLGANFGHIRKLFFVDAVFFSTLSAVFYGIFAAIINWIIFKFANINLGGNLIRFEFDVPWWGIVIGFATAVLSSFFSVMGAYWSFKRKSAPVFTGKEVELVDNGSVNAIYDSDAK